MVSRNTTKRFTTVWYNFYMFFIWRALDSIHCSIELKSYCLPIMIFPDLYDFSFICEYSILWFSIYFGAIKILHSNQMLSYNAHSMFVRKCVWRDTLECVYKLCVCMQAFWCSDVLQLIFPFWLIFRGYQEDTVG